MSVAFTRQVDMVKKKAVVVRRRSLLTGVKVALLQHPGLGWEAVLGGLVWDDRMSGIRHKTFQRKPRNRLITIIADAGDGPKWVVISFIVLLDLLRIFQIKS